MSMQNDLILMKQMLGNKNQCELSVGSKQRGHENVPLTYVQNKSCLLLARIRSLLKIELQHLIGSWAANVSC